MKNYEQDLKAKQREVDKIERKKEKAEEVLKEKKKEQLKYSRELAKIEQDIREVVSCKTFKSLLFSPQRIFCHFNFTFILCL